MGGNGTFASGKIASYRWETVGTVHGAKVLELKDKGLSRKLPEEAHSSRMYIQQHADGSFSQLRVYDKQHRLRIEIGYHPERSLDATGRDVLHYHIYRQPGFEHGKPHRMSTRQFKRYQKYMKGIIQP